MHVSLNYYSGFVSQLKSFHCRLNETVMKLYSVYTFSISMQKKKKNDYIDFLIFI